MRTLLANSLLLAFISNLAGAATQPIGKETLIFTSSPHPAAMKKGSKDEKDTRFNNVAEQYSWINNYKPHGQSVIGVVLNGNLTESGEKSDWEKIDALFRTLKVPYLLGLGANDYLLNQDQTLYPAYAVRSIWYFNRHIVNKMILKKEGVYAGIGNVYFDFVQAITGKSEGEKSTHGIGKLGYTVELGANKNIYLIQLNGHVGANVAENKFILHGKDRDFDISEDYFHINPVVDWLENRLEYAAQYQLNHPGALPKTVVVTMNGDSVDPAIVNVLDKYKIALRFLGNDGSSANCKKNSTMTDDSKFYCLGFSTTRELLELELNYGENKSAFSVYHRTVKPDSVDSVRTEVALSLIQPHYSTGTYPARDKVVLFSHYGSYYGQASVRDPSTNKTYQDTSSKIMPQNSGVIYELPKDITKFDVSFLPKDKDEEVLSDSSRKDLTSPVVCVETSGYSWASSRNYYQKVLQSTQDTSLNRCFDEWWGYYY